MKKLTANYFIDQLSILKSKKHLESVQRFYRDEEADNAFMGIRMADLFKQAKLFSEMPLNEIDKLLQSKYYEARMGAVSIMDFQARKKKTTAERKKNCLTSI